VRVPDLGGVADPCGAVGIARIQHLIQTGRPALKRFAPILTGCTNRCDFGRKTIWKSPHSTFVAVALGFRSHAIHHAKQTSAPTPYRSTHPTDRYVFLDQHSSTLKVPVGPPGSDVFQRFSKRSDWLIRCRSIVSQRVYPLLLVHRCTHHPLHTVRRPEYSVRPTVSHCATRKITISTYTSYVYTCSRSRTLTLHF
jgi:hypothetical protein